MTSVGAHLRELRARHGVCLDEIVRRTRVPTRYLEALEADAFDTLPAPVFTRGFIRAYCQALGEAPDDALACYEGRDGRVPPRPVPRPAPAARTAPRTRGAVLVSFVLLVVLGMALFTVALVIQPPEGLDRVLTTRPQAPPPAAEPETAEPAATMAPAPALAPPSESVAAPGPAPSARPAPTTSPPSPTPPVGPASPAPRPVTPPAPVSPSAAPAVSAPYRLVARTSEATWIRVRTEDGRTSEETVPAGEVREWVSDRPFVLTLGNAGGVTLELNGRPLPPLGAHGVVIPRLVIPPESR
jgi:cytoskeleton protein RodZ